ncbi:hypothetical protein LEP1GSC050_3318 [Leptospira broomii serovar Hurstbridge str. 5399]|uniref:Uncharacterized protein n=1 Tax=Leptospira broomii serovar Hurstbridge str. 5399 TaxID=1049789 RepID=T0FCF5_9LEPT|nr:hypothetical protein LEP1GSC050_3318 [Leptospira broomii serovar Hurstbridge str. 5399]
MATVLVNFKPVFPIRYKKNLAACTEFGTLIFRIYKTWREKISPVLTDIIRWNRKIKKILVRRRAKLGLFLSRPFPVGI